MPPVEDCGVAEGRGAATGGTGRTGQLAPVEGAGVWIVGLGGGGAIAGEPNWTLPLMLRSTGACAGAGWNGAVAGGQPSVFPWRGANSWPDSPEPARGVKPPSLRTGVSEEP